MRLLIDISSKLRDFASVCLHVYIHVYVCVCKDVRMYVCMYVCVYVCMYAFGKFRISSFFLPCLG